MPYRRTLNMEIAMEMKRDIRHGYLVLRCEEYPNCHFKIQEHIHIYRKMLIQRDCSMCPSKLEEIRFSPCDPELCKLEREDYVKQR